jgi:hypothetical protein
MHEHFKSLYSTESIKENESLNEAVNDKYLDQMISYMELRMLFSHKKI